MRLNNYGIYNNATSFNWLGIQWSGGTSDVALVAAGLFAISGAISFHE